MFHKIGYTKNFRKIFNEKPKISQLSTSKVSSRRTIDWNHNIQSRYLATKLYLYCVIPYKSDHARHAYTTVYRNLYDTNKSYWLYADATFPLPVAKILEVTKINFLQDFERRRRPRLNVEKHSCDDDDSSWQVCCNLQQCSRRETTSVICLMLNVRYRDCGIPISTRQGYFEFEIKKKTRMAPCMDRVTWTENFPRVKAETRLTLRVERFLPLHGQLTRSRVKMEMTGRRNRLTTNIGRRVRHDTVDSARLVLSLDPTPPTSQLYGVESTRRINNRAKKNSIQGAPRIRCLRSRARLAFPVSTP